MILLKMVIIIILNYHPAHVKLYSGQIFILETHKTIKRSFIWVFFCFYLQPEMLEVSQ